MIMTILLSKIYIINIINYTTLFIIVLFIILLLFIAVFWKIHEPIICTMIYSAITVCGAWGIPQAYFSRIVSYCIMVISLHHYYSNSLMNLCRNMHFPIKSSVRIIWKFFARCVLHSANLNFF